MSHCKSVADSGFRLNGLRYISLSSRYAVYLAGLLAVFALNGCIISGQRNAATLYEQLGGREGISVITEEMLIRSADDPRIRDDFAEANIVHLHEQLTTHLCALSGGPCVYQGRDMKAAHVGLGLTAADFNALVENLVDAMNERGVPISAQNELVAILAPMRSDVIQR